MQEKAMAWIKANKEKLGLILGGALLVLAFRGVFGGNVLETSAKMAGAFVIGYNFNAWYLKAKGLLLKVEEKL